MAVMEELAEISGRPLLHNVIQAFADKPYVHRRGISWLERCLLAVLLIRFGIGSDWARWSGVWGRGVVSGCGPPVGSSASPTN